MNEELYFDEVGSELLINAVKRQAGPIDAVSTGFPTWDRVCRGKGGRQGLAIGWYVVIGGATGKGKTAIVLNLLATAVKQGRRVGLINFEMSLEEIATRYLTIATGLDSRFAEPGRDLDLKKASAAANLVDTFKGRLYTNRDPVISLAEFRASVVALLENGCSVIAADYLQLIHIEGIHEDYRQTKVVSNLFRQMVHKRGFLGIGLSQLNTEAGKSELAPTEYNLHGGGKWAMDADQVCLIDHTSHEPDENDPFTAFSRLIIRKNRHGPAGQFPIRWDWKTLKASEVDLKHGEEPPPTGADDGPW